MALGSGLGLTGWCGHWHELTQDQTEIATRQQAAANFLSTAVTSYLCVLTSSDGHPWAVMFRLVALWFDNHSDREARVSPAVRGIIATPG